MIWQNLTSLFSSIWFNLIDEYRKEQQSSRKTPTSASLTMLKPLTVWITTKWKILKELAVPDHLTHLLRNLYWVKKQKLEPHKEKTNWFKIGKWVWQGSMLSSAYLTSLQSTSCEIPGWMNHKLESRRQGEISITSDIQLKNHSNVRMPRGPKEPLNEGERGGWKSWLKTQHPKKEDHGIQSHHFRANRWGNNGNSDRLSLLGLQNHSRLWLQLWN